jgi:hypothetical protein
MSIPRRRNQNATPPDRPATAEELVDVLERLPEEELTLIVEALGPRSPDNPILQLWTAISLLTSISHLPEDFRKKCAAAVPFLTKSAGDLLGGVPLWTAALLSLLVKAHPWFHGGLFGIVLRRAFPRLMADMKKRDRGKIRAVLRRKKAGQTLGQIAHELGIPRESVKGTWKRHKPKPA